MSALPSPSQTHNGQNEAAADPSMEEILASIRRIIADDHGAPVPPKPPRPAAPVIEASSQPVARETVPARHPQPQENRFLDRIAQIENAPARARPAPRPTIEGMAAPAEPRVMAEPRVTVDVRPAPEPRAPRLDAALHDAAPRPAQRVAQQVAQQFSPTRPEPAPEHVEALLSPAVRDSVTSAFEALTVSMALQNSSVVEKAVQEMLRPMLKQWLDDNLPTIVERLVRSEIERVARGGRS